VQPRNECHFMPNNLHAADVRRPDVGVIFALGIESGFLEDSVVGRVTVRGDGFKAIEGELRGRRIVILLAGPGRPNAARATEALIDGHRPECVLSAGFAGGLAPELKRHEIVLAQEVILESGQRIEMAPLPTAGATAIGKLLTADCVVRLADEKIALFERTGASAVDMESFAVAEVCARHGVPFRSARIIHDPADQTLPSDIEKLLNQKTEIARWGAAIGALWKRPSSIKDMWALKENSLVASQKLAEFIANWVAVL
jgi:adenosylhomocysteine nucleosidase